MKKGYIDLSNKYLKPIALRRRIIHYLRNVLMGCEIVDDTSSGWHIVNKRSVFEIFNDEDSEMIDVYVHSPGHSSVMYCVKSFYPLKWMIERMEKWEKDN